MSQSHFHYTISGTLEEVQGKFVQLKVNRPPLKTLRISIIPAERRMRVGQLWQVEAMRQGDYLVLKIAYIEKEWCFS